MAADPNMRRPRRNPLGRNRLGAGLSGAPVLLVLLFGLATALCAFGVRWNVALARECAGAGSTAKATMPLPERTLACPSDAPIKPAIDSNWPGLAPVLILLIGSSASILLAVCLRRSARNRARMEALVRHCTEERESALEAMRLSEQRLHDYLETASDWHWETDATWHFTHVSSKARQHGIDPDGMVGLDRLAEEAADADGDDRRQILERHATFLDMRFDYPVEKGLRTLSLNGTPVFDAFGVCVGYRGSARDITGQLRGEAEQRSARWAAEQASRAKSTFLAAMSHEIRTPMNGVLGMLQLLRDTPLTREQQHMCDTIYQSGSALQQILNDILDYSKLEAGRITLEMIGSRLPNLVRSVAALMRGSADAKGLVIEIRILGEDVPVLVDPTRIRQILFNLLSNAIKFSEQGPVTVTLEIQRRDRDQAEIVLAVTDRGIGISPGAQQRLFGRFIQADASTTRRFGGTGLGLSITRELTTLMGGTIEVDSALGIGSTFTVRLVLEITGEAAAETEAAPAGEPNRTPRRRLRILVAEDDAINQEVIQGMLRDHSVQMADNGLVAVAFAEREAFDLVLMDVMMPVMDGIAATAAIRALPPPANALPIVALTANAMAGDRERYFTAGMNGYVSKPIQRPELLRSIEQLLGESVWASPAAPAAATVETVSTEATESIDSFLASLG